MNSVPARPDHGFVAIVVRADGELATRIVQRLVEAEATVVEIERARIDRSGGDNPRMFVDLDDWRETEKCVGSIVASYGRIDCLVQLSPLPRPASLFGTAEHDYGGTLRGGLDSAFLLSRHVARHMASDCGGSILHIIASPAGVPATGQRLSSAGQVGIAQLSRALAVELAGVNIRSNAILIPSDPGQSSRSDGRAASESNTAELCSPLFGAVPLRMEDAVLFLSTHAAEGISGQVFEARSSGEYGAPLRGGWISGHDTVA